MGILDHGHLPWSFRRVLVHALTRSCYPCTREDVVGATGYPAYGAFSNSFWIGLAACHTCQRQGVTAKQGITNVNELLEIVIQTRQVVFPPLVLCDELLLPLQKILPLLLKMFAFYSLMLNSSEHELILVIVRGIRMKHEEFFDRHHRELLVFVTAARVSFALIRLPDRFHHSLVRLASRDFTLQVSLFVIEVL